MASSSSDSVVSRLKGVKYPFRSTHSLLWKSCQRDNAFANTMKGSIKNNNKRTAEAAFSKMVHGNSNRFETSKVDPTDTYRLPTDRRSLEKIKVLSTQQSMCIDFIKNEIILSKCAGSTTGNVFHLGGLPGAGKTATITSLIEDLADANMTAKGTVLLCSKTNAAKSNMFSSCVDQSTPGKDGGYLVESKFVTVNSGFAIPVIKNSADTEDVMIQGYINNLSRKFISNICLSDMIVMDEYTMTNINEILFIDCLLRASRGRPNVPFGGTPVIFLGDNRQNSAVVDRRNSSTTMIRGEGGGAIDVNLDKDKAGGRNVIDLISEVLLKVLIIFIQSKDFITLFIRGCEMRKDALVDRHSYIKSLIDDNIAMTNEVPNKRPRTSSSSSTSQTAPEEDNSSMDSLDLFNDSDFEELMTEMLGVLERPLTTFAARTDKIRSANGGGKEEEGGGIGKVAKITGYDVLREEALRAEIAHVDKYLSCKGDRTKKMVNDMVEEIAYFATLAVREIINTGRERLYILSGMTDVLQDCHVLSLANEEIINIKLNFGKDPKCLDSTEIVAKVSEGVEDERAERVSDAIMNAMFRSGDEPKGFVPLAEVFKFNLKELMEKLSREDLTAQDLIDLANRAARGEVATKQGKQEQRRAVELDSEGEEEEEEGYYDDYGEEEEEQEITSRSDKPNEIDINDRTHERVRKTVSFAQEYYKCYLLFSPVTRARFWHTYLLARDVQTVNRFASPVVSPFSKKSAGEETIQFQEPYWLRALSLPMNSSLDTSNMQSAYAAYLSMLSRTFIMSSQKRISVAHHSLGMMYSMSLFDMTVDARALVDFRDITSSIPIGFAHKFLPVEYLQAIFPSIVSEFLVTTKAAISNEVRDVKNSGSKGGGSLDLDLSIINETVKKMGIDSSRQSKIANCVFIGSSILANIAKANIFANMMKEKNIKAEQTLLDKLLSGDKDAAAAEDMKKRRGGGASSGPVGALALTKGHSQKNTITDLVEKTMAVALKKSTNYKQGVGNKVILHNELPSLRFETKFWVGGLDLSKIGHNRCITQQQKQIIMSKCNSARASGKGVFIDKLTDIKLTNSTSIRDFMGHLIKLRDNVTRVQESILFVGQSVTFTHSNRPTNSPYDCNTMFYTTDTGFIKKIESKGNKSVIHVVLDKSGEVAEVSPGNESSGPIVNGHHGANVYYFPLTSSKALTIYSSQGQTFWRDVIVDITDASSQDVYVAVTRNADVLNLKIMSSSDKEMSSLHSIKTTMGRDKTNLFPLGGLRGVNASDAVDQHRKSRRIVVHDSYRMQTAVLDKTRDLVAAAQKFIMNLTNNNTFAFNSSWMENTGKIMKRNGLEQRLEDIESFFFDPETPRIVIDYYNEQTNRTLMQLFLCVQRSVLHYCMTSKCIKTPSMSALKAHRNGAADHVKFHPAFVNSPLKPETIETLFFDVAPHSFVTKVFQFYTHFLFLVYEQSHMCLSSFAFLPSASPTYNASTRVKMDDKTREKVKENVLFVPGEDALAYEPPEFTDAKDGCIRTRDRRAIVGEDFRVDKLLERASSDFVAEDPVVATAVMEAIGKAQKYNLRRAGKYCKKGEAVGLNTHGTVAIACDCKNLSKSNLHLTEILGGEEWASFSYEANLYGMLTFMTKLAAASGVTKKVSVVSDGGAALLPPATRLHGYSVELSPEILYCGQCDPMFKVQFLFHCTMLPKKEMTTGGDAEENLLGPEFENKMTKGRKVKNSVKVVIMTETYGGASFANTTTSEVRNSLFMGLGKVRVEEKKTMAEANALINKFLKVKRFKRVSFFLSVSI
uniref:Wsv447-like protein n=1 Tax=Hemigrapsus takanoi nimavirus TaxID=2133792 RepID=A0A401IP29_9VIRU|nr:MAG: wsv447-like protein [Hemigrapsus takanoi nimavirus]GBG35366.1 wsv447-like protein [Hemigrapsus takanoi nimavirus]